MLFWRGHMLNVVRRRARERRAAAAACLQSSAYVAAARARVAIRCKALKLLSRPPRPMPSYDVGEEVSIKGIKSVGHTSLVGIALGRHIERFSRPAF